MTSVSEIKANNIKAQLASLEAGPQNLIKACLFNLMVYTDPSRSQYFHNIIFSIIEKFPCRIFFIECSVDDSQNYLQVAVSNEITGKGGTKIACDEITIQTTQSQLKRTPFIILPNLVPDLPIYLLWGQDPTHENEIFPSLQKLAKRVIYDAECSSNLSSFSIKILQQLDTMKTDVMDLNWAIIEGWRDVLAQTFSTPESIQHLKNCKSMQVYFNARESQQIFGFEIQAAYLQAWIASQMDWKFISMSTSEKQRTITYSSNGQEIAVALIPQQKANLIPGTILSFELESFNDHTYSITRKTTQSQVSVYISSSEKCELPFTLPLPNLQRGGAFAKAIFYQSSNGHYRRMLKMLAQSNWKLTGSKGSA